MIKHIVMWNVRGATPDQKDDAIRFLKSRFEGLIGHIPGLHHLEVGVDTSGVDYACDVVLYTEFESQQALDAYATHPAHMRVRAPGSGHRADAGLARAASCIEAK